MAEKGPYYPSIPAPGTVDSNSGPGASANTRNNRPHWPKPLLLLGLGALLAGCSQPEIVGVSFSAQVQPIFTEHCVSCHSAEGAQGGLILAASSAYEDIVGVPSDQSELLLVKASDPQGSYLIHKLEGTQAVVGGYGAQMPAYEDPLPTEDIDLISQWIAQGAKDN